MADAFITKNDKRYMWRTTKGWKMCVEWRDRSTSWERWVGLKESNPVDVTQYAISRGIDHEPTFCWWVRHMLKKQDRIINMVKARTVK